MATSPKFEELYKKLNRRQREAVDVIDGPVMVIAGPGTGKTHILTLRIANILQKTDTPPHGILAITYTDAGVRAMRENLHKIIGDRAYEVRLHTFHSFASSIIAEYPDHFLHLSDMKLMTDVEQEVLIRDILSLPQFSTLRPTGKPDVYVPGILRSIDDAKREALSPEMVRQFNREEIERLKGDETSLSTRGATKGHLKAEARELIEKSERTMLFADIYELYESRKRENKNIDFNDLIIELLSALRTDELLLRLIQEKYLYIHVDEHQDTNDAQNFIVGLIAEFFETPNIFIVGDEKQAIYRFQGASVENFFLLRKRWPAMKVISLDTNYRSHQSILDASFSMIEKNYEEDEHTDLRIHLKAGSGNKSKPIEIVTGENTSATELRLIEELKGIPEEATAAIIVRRNRDLDRVTRLLELHGISVSSERSIDIFNHPIGKLFFYLLEYLADNSKIESLARTLVVGMWRLSFEESINMIRLMRSGMISEADRKLPALKDIQKKLSTDGALGFIIHAADESGFTELVAKDPTYVQVWRGIVALAESLVREEAISDPLILIQKMLSYRTSAESRTVKVSLGTPDAHIQALTAHGSKGLEFDYIFLPYATDNAWIGKPRGASFVLPKKRTSDSDIRDVRRLFYVALTRARKHVTVLTANHEPDGSPLSPLRFIDELDSKHIKHISLPQTGIEKVYSAAPAKKNINSEKVVDLSKRVLIEKGLSVTALNHFMECPAKFIYLSVLKIPQAPNASAEKGNAMHAALSKVWKAPRRKATDIIDILNNEIVNYFERSFLGMEEKMAAKNELLKNVPEIAKALEPHFAIDKGASVFTELRVENKFDANYKKEKITIPLHGNLDAIVDSGNNVMIYDYKSRQALSVAAIKGETKNSDGNYFRQLIFYKLLTQTDPRWKFKKISPALVFVSPDEKGRCPTITLPIEESDVNRVKAEIQGLIENVWSGKFTTEKCSDEKCEWCGLLSLS
jgi:DNA helicase-2/ATP-dependent DNA helicase PcrA